MICPSCKNKDFEKTSDLNKPIHNLGGKESYDTADYRRYSCLQCGHSWITCEKFERDINVRRNKQVEMFPVTARTRNAS